MCTDRKIEYYQAKAVRTGKWSEDKGIVLGFRSVDEEMKIEMEKKTLLENALQQANFFPGRRSKNPPCPFIAS